MIINKMCKGCGNLIEYPATYCDNCKIDVEQKKLEQYKKNKKIWDKKYNAKRNPLYTKFYNSKEWFMLKEQYLSDHDYKCEECVKIKLFKKNYRVAIAEEVHHIEFLSTDEGWKRRLDYNNLQALCHRHHDMKHDRFQPRH